MGMWDACGLTSNIILAGVKWNIQPILKNNKLVDYLEVDFNESIVFF